MDFCRSAAAAASAAPVSGGGCGGGGFGGSEPNALIAASTKHARLSQPIALVLTGDNIVRPRFLCVFPSSSLRRFAAATASSTVS